MLIVVAPALIAASTQRHRKSSSVRVRVLRRPLDVVDVVARARHRRRSPSRSTCSGSICSLCFMCTGEVERKVWMRPPLGRLDRLAAAVDVLVARRATGRRPRRSWCAWRSRDGLEIAVGGDREAGLDDVDAHVVEQLGDFELLLVGHGGAGRLLAVAQGGVENDDAVLVGLVVEVMEVSFWSDAPLRGRCLEVMPVFSSPTPECPGAIAQPALRGG